MTRDDYLALLQRALSTPHGVALDFDDWVQAERARGRFYRLGPLSGVLATTHSTT
jgi:hypothetical protein